jgi:transcriptional regulator with XRE-family HTH domain
MLGKRIEQLMKMRGVTKYRVSKDTGIPYTTLSQIISGRTKDPQVSVLQALADYFEVPLDYLLGQSARAIVEERMEELGMSLEDLASASGISVERLRRMDDWELFPSDYEPGGLVDKLAKALGLDRKQLASAFARQEPPVYDGGSVDITPAELEFLHELQQEAAWYDFIEGPEERKRELIRAVKFLLRGSVED